MNPPRWKVTVHQTLEGALYARKLHAPKVFAALCETMDLLALEYDPRYPRNRRLCVKSLEWDTDSRWYRVNVNPYNYRAVFRVLERRDGAIIELAAMDLLDEAADGRAIQVMDYSHRCRVYDRLEDIFGKVA